ncbi:MAG TPA: Type 1 glutamine amidotransferase-like domain-containing protein [Chitinophagaceae bacterium]|nr:Type 1 glutamine amidotransferase-like domain-containing protein [Chitinophagaceae bacterium]
MRLFLSSFRFGNHPQHLVRLANSNKRAAVIANACDEMPENDRQIRVRQEIGLLQELGFFPGEIDLRSYFNNPHRQQHLIKLLSTVGLIWVRGGNSFVLRRAMKASGFDVMITGLVQQDAVVYGGYSAGACVTGPTLAGIEMVDDPHTVPEGYDATVIWEGLNLVPYVIVPHYRSILPESAKVERLLQHYVDRNISFKPLRDEEAVVVNGDQSFCA